MSSILLNQFDELKEEVAVEQRLKVVCVDAERPSPALDKLTEAEARKKPSEDTAPKFIGEGLVVDDVLYHFILQKERRERYLARRQDRSFFSIDLFKIRDM
ncbi:hypothetical protein SASPL_154184 [Salvia splendens]|uniref:Uncharacterized protein n=1 Tax=Salvia splendens TaxID=180675 RepID=A0A8X8W041_SALSN|nr:hypothetical protein SASPL_154184 [Salvia splendens]